VACRPEVDRLGLVLPSRNSPHSGWPYFFQPSGSVASAARSDQPIAFLGQPSASAMGRGIAMVSGEVMIGGNSPSGTGEGLSSAPVRSRSMAGQTLAAGLHTSGRLPSVRSSQPRASASMAMPEFLESTWISTHLPSIRRSSAKSSAACCSRPTLS